jgi:hypothetical protein
MRKIPPDAQQCLLRRILGKVEITQDPARHGQEPIGQCGSKARKCLLVAVLCRNHEIGIHALFRGSKDRCELQSWPDAKRRRKPRLHRR